MNSPLSGFPFYDPINSRSRRTVDLVGGREGFVANAMDERILIAFSADPQQTPPSLEMLTRQPVGSCVDVPVNWPTFRLQFSIRIKLSTTQHEIPQNSSARLAATLLCCWFRATEALLLVQVEESCWSARSDRSEKRRKHRPSIATAPPAVPALTSGDGMRPCRRVLNGK